MKGKHIGYWAATGLTALAFGAGGAMDLVGSKEVVDGFAHLGYAPYVATLLGVWKLLGAAAIVAPGLPRLKEWAYAGMIFDLTGAAFSHAMSHDPAGKVVTPLVIALVVAASWALRPSGRVLGEIGASNGPASERSGPAPSPAAA